MQREFWANAFLTRLGAPVTRHNRMVMVVWMQSEGSPFAWNPLATTLKRPGSQTMNSHGVQAYPSYSVGMDASVATIREPQYDKVVNRLMRNARPGRTLEAIAASPWGTGGSLMSAVLTSAKRGYYDDYAEQQIPS